MLKKYLNYFLFLISWFIFSNIMADTNCLSSANIDSTTNPPTVLGVDNTALPAGWTYEIIQEPPPGAVTVWFNRVDCDVSSATTQCNKLYCTYDYMGFPALYLFPPSDTTYSTSSGTWLNESNGYYCKDSAESCIFLPNNKASTQRSK